MRTAVREALFGGPWLANWGALYWALAFVALSTDVALSSDAVVAISMFAVVVAILWLVELVRWIVRRKERTDKEPGLSWVLPGVAGLLVLLALSGLPLRARFEFSRSAFTEHAKSYREQELGGQRSELRVGSYRVLDVRPVRGGSFFVTRSAFLTDAGFVHAPGASDTSAFDRNLGGGWWTMRQGQLFGPLVGPGWLGSSK